MDLDLGFKSGGEVLAGYFSGWIVAYDRGSLEQVGFLQYTLLDEEYYLDHIEVYPQFRRKGICRQLIEAFMEQEGIPYERIHWAAGATSGRKVKKKMDRRFLKEEAPSQAPRSITYRGKTYHRMVYDAEDQIS
jgi:GNAT superfamily N-acetyltransferase